MLLLSKNVLGSLFCSLIARMMRNICRAGRGDRQTSSGAALRASPGPGVGSQLAIGAQPWRQDNPSHQERGPEKETSHRASGAN